MISPQSHAEPRRAIEEEMALLGCLILESRTADIVAPLVGIGSFYLEKHGAIYGAIQSLRQSVGQVDLVLLQRHLSESGVLGQVGGVEYLIELAESVPSATSAEYYAKTVRSYYDLRRLNQCCRELAFEANQCRADDADALVATAQQKIFDLSRRTTLSASGCGDLMRQIYANIEDQHDTSHDGYTDFGYTELDGIVGGIASGEVVVIGGRSSMGKSAMGVNLLLRMADAGHPGLYITMEMSVDAVAQRVMAVDSGVPLCHVRRPYQAMTDRYFEQMQKAVVGSADRPMWIVDGAGHDLSRLSATIRRYVAEHGVKVVVLDQLQLITGPGDTEVARLTEITRQIKIVARTSGVAILLLSQINRSAVAERGVPDMPQLQHLRGSGTIEQDADTVLILHRPDYYHQRLNPTYVPDYCAQVGVAKNRDGPTGNVTLRFHPETTRFSDW